MLTTKTPKIDSELKNIQKNITICMENRAAYNSNVIEEKIISKNNCLVIIDIIDMRMLKCKFYTFKRIDLNLMTYAYIMCL